MTIVIKDRSYGIDLCTEERHIYTSGLGLVGVPMRPYDAISVYMMINENFKGGLNNVMLRIKDPVDSCYHLSSVSRPSKTGCSVVLCGPTRPDRSTGSHRPAEFMFGIISVETPVALKALFFNTGGLSTIIVTKTGLVNPVPCG